MAGSVPGFRVYTLQLNAQLRLRFLVAPHTVNLATEYKSLTHLGTNGMSHTIKVLPLLLRHYAVSGSFSLPLCRGSFQPFLSGYWFTIGQSGVFSLGGWSPHIQTGYIVSCPTFRSSACAFWCDHPVPSDFPDRSTNTLRIKLMAARSLAATGESLLISFPRGTKMFLVPGSR